MAAYELVRTAAALAERLPVLRSARVIGVDLETTGLDPHADRVRLVQLAVPGTPVLVIDCDTALPEGLPALREALGTRAVKVLQNAKFDLQFLLALGIEVSPVFDTMLAGQMLYMPGTPRRANLQTLAEHYLGETVDKAEQTSDFAGPLREAQLAYAARDAEILPRLRGAMLPRLMEAGLARVAEIEFACVRAVAAMEYAGICLRRDAWDALLRRTEAERDAALLALTPFTGPPMAQTSLLGGDVPLDNRLDSNPYVLGLLRRHGINVEATSRGDLYPYRDDPLVRALSAYRKASKAVSAILLPVREAVHPVTGRLHPHYGQISAYSGRMSCSGPNIQQIPRGADFRACIAAPEGRTLVIADYSQIELRVAAQMSGDARMLDAYRRGEDLHALTASLLTGVPMDRVTRQGRQAAKAVNFGLIYGMGAAGLAQYAQQSYGVPMTQAEAAAFRQRFFAAYRGVAAWHARLKERPPTEGRTLAGRRFPVSPHPSLPEMSNAPVQGTGADILKRALGLLVPRLAGTDVCIVAAVHDEILLEAPEGEGVEIAALLRETMEEAARPILPDVPAVADAKVSATWAEK
ncbi:bifunctional 3'-5' exonuclease/DNA polymerase [Eubacteriales bacterium OttesenSCG-928-A19]|nr:bifunctional 3'-5' exonuclease/DNA polymerase [Eubacteriales bacterium OttesenSCG-928-A19]